MKGISSEINSRRKLFGNHKKSADSSINYTRKLQKHYNLKKGLTKGGPHGESQTEREFK